MKLTKIIVIFFILTLGVPKVNGIGQAGGDINNLVTKALSKGDATEVARFFANNIDLTMADKDGSFSKSQATLILKDFFKKYPVSSYSVKQTGRSAEGSTFTIGEYVSGNNSFRVYYHVRKSGDTAVIQILEFDGD